MPKMPSFHEAARYGFHFHGATHWIDKSAPNGVAFDAAGGLYQTVPNTALPASVFSVVDPTVIEARQAPLKATDIFPERKLGDWTTLSYHVPKKEYAGTTEPYADLSDTPTSGVNYNWFMVQNYLYQTYLYAGSLETARMSEAGLNLLADKQQAVARILGWDENRIYLLGIDGLPVYGILNHPSLLPSVSPLPWTPSGGGSAVTQWQDKDSQAVYDDILYLFSVLVGRGKGLIDENTSLKLILSPGSNVQLLKRTRSSMDLSQESVMAALRAMFPNLTVITLPELSSDTAGETVMMIADVPGGPQTGELLYSEKMRSFEPYRKHTNYEQKFMAGTWGAVIYEPLNIATMVGV